MKLEQEKITWQLVTIGKELAKRKAAALMGEHRGFNISSLIVCPHTHSCLIYRVSIYCVNSEP